MSLHTPEEIPEETALSKIEIKYSALVTSVESTFFLPKVKDRQQVQRASTLVNKTNREKNTPYAKTILEWIWHYVKWERSLLFLAVVLSHSLKNDINRWDVKGFLLLFETWATKLQNVPSMSDKYKYLFPDITDFSDPKLLSFTPEAGTVLGATVAEPIHHTDTMQGYLNEMDGIDKVILTTLSNLKLSTSNNICQNPSDPLTNEIKPRIISADMCWKRRPIHFDILNQTIYAIRRSDCTTFSRGEASATVNPIHAIAQLHCPDRNDPVFLTGLRLPCIDHCGFGVPVVLSQVVEAFGEGNIQEHLTPKFTIVDLHIDRGADGLSTVLDGCNKYFLCFPPTMHNLTLMKDGQKEKLVRLGPRMEQGEIYKITSKDAIYIPAGCIHATITTRGGYLISKDFTTPSSVLPFARYISLGFYEDLSEIDAADCFDRFAECLTLSLDASHQRIPEALEAWVLAFDRFLAWSRTAHEWRDYIVTIWENFLKSRYCTEKCPCGWVGTEGFVQHFENTHLSPLPEKRLPEKRLPKKRLPEKRLCEIGNQGARKKLRGSG